MFPNFLPFLQSVVTNFWTEIAVIVFLFIFRYLGIDFYPKAMSVLHYVQSVVFSLFGYKKVLLYTDCDDVGTTTRSLKKAVQKQFLSKKFLVSPLTTPEAFLQYYLSPRHIRAVIVLITDVTTLSSDIKKREKIQTKLVSFCHKGGILILGHDTIYRRAKNDKLQKLAGCTLTNFIRTKKPIKYTKNINIDIKRKTSCSMFLDQLPDEFYLNDGECIHGNWCDDVEFIYVCDGTIGSRKLKVPLVTRRTAGDGIVCWLNSADHDEYGPPEPIAAPSKEFTAVLCTIILYSKDVLAAASVEKQQN